MRGFHYYRRIWCPVESQKLQCYFEHGNPFDRFAIKIITAENKVVGHLPRELSRVPMFLLDRGAHIELTLTSTNYQRSPLVQGGLEIACEVVVKMPGTVRNHRYITLVKERYTEPKDETIMGSFLVSVPEPLADGNRTINHKKKKTHNTVVASRNIRDMFNAKRKNDDEPIMLE